MKGVTVGGQNINSNRHANDTMLLAENELYLQKMLAIVREKGMEYGLNVNV